ncbi:unnamed protein product, partial [Candidula unifasciata]
VINMFKRGQSIFLSEAFNMYTGKVKEQSEICVNCGTWAVDEPYIDKKRPFTGNVCIYGRFLSGRGYLYYVRTYCQFEKRHKNLNIHLQSCLRDCKPLSKTVKDNVLKVTKALGSKMDFSKVQLNM